MVEPESGVITIDGVDISSLGLRHLRSQMSIIPQEPFLFSGSVRSNLDPFNSYAEPDLWRAVESVGLKDAITALQDGLDAHVVDGGNNFSQVGAAVCGLRALYASGAFRMLTDSCGGWWAQSKCAQRSPVAAVPRKGGPVLRADWSVADVAGGVSLSKPAGPEAAVLSGARDPAQQQGADAGRGDREC
jgi:hypothetical protein